MISHIVLHYSATYDDQDIGAAEIDRMHRARGWSGIGYHYVIRLDGTIEPGRQPETRVGAHVGGHNTGKIGICCVGGLTRATGSNTGVDTRTQRQIDSLVRLIREIQTRQPGAKVAGHRDLKATQCPGYDAAAWWASIEGDAMPEVPAPEAPTVSYPMVRRGSKGRVVEALQTALAALGYGVGPVDGDFGPKTDAAVRAFQTAVCVDVDGIVGPMTWAAIYSRLKG